MGEESEVKSGTTHFLTVQLSTGDCYTKLGAQVESKLEQPSLTGQ